MTQAGSSWGAPPQHRLRPWHILLIIFGGVALFGLGLWQLLSWALGPLTERADMFMGAMRARNFEQAYALSTPALQRELGDAARMRASTALPAFSEWSWGQRSIRNNMGLLSGTVRYEGGRGGAVTLQLEHLNGEWRVYRYRFEPPR